MDRQSSHVAMTPTSPMTSDPERSKSDLLDSFLESSKSGENQISERLKEKGTPGPYFVYFMRFFLLFYIPLLLPLLLAQMILAFASLVGIPHGVRMARAIWCLFTYQIDVYHVVGADKEWKITKAMRILFFVITSPLLVFLFLFNLFGFFLVATVAPLFACLLLPIIRPQFWLPSKRKGLRRSFLQALAVMANSTWSALLFSACKGNWDVDQHLREKVLRTPPHWERVIVFILFLGIGIALPINDTVSDFLYSKTLVEVYLLRPNQELLGYVIVSFLSAGFGLIVTLYGLIRVLIGFGRAHRQVPSNLMMYSYYQLEIMDDFEEDSPLRPRLRTHVLTFAGTFLEDAVQLVLLYLSAPFTASYSAVFYFSLVTSILGISHYWSEILTMLMTFQAFKKLGSKILFRVVAFAFLSALLALPLISDAITDMNPFCFIEQIYAPFLVEQYDTCSFLANLVIKDLNGNNLQIPYSKDIGNLTITQNPNLESVVFPNLRGGGFINVTDNEHLFFVSLPMVQVNFTPSHHLSQSKYRTSMFFHSTVKLPDYFGDYGNPVDPLGLVIVNNSKLETFSATSLNVNTLQVVNNPKLRGLLVSKDFLVGTSAQIQGNAMLETVKVEGVDFNAQPIISLTDNDGLQNATVKATAGYVIHVVGNALINTLTLDISFTPLALGQVIINSGSASIGSQQIAIVDNPNLTLINLPSISSVAGSYFAMTGYHGDIAYSDQVVSYP